MQNVFLTAPLLFGLMQLFILFLIKIWNILDTVAPLLLLLFIYFLILILFYF